MQAIQTKYLGPTNSRGARIKVWAEAGAMIVSYDHALSAERNHVEAIRKYAEKWGWFGRWTIGGAEKGYVATCQRMPADTIYVQSPEERDAQ